MKLVDSLIQFLQSLKKMISVYLISVDQVSYRNENIFDQNIFSTNFCNKIVTEIYLGVGVRQYSLFLLKF